MELFKLLGTIAVENDKANSAIDETTGKAEQSESKISSAFKKIGGVVATAFAVDKIKDFGVACVENAAEVKAANSQFEQTFGELQSKAGAAIDKIAEKSGILATRLNGTATSIYAFARSSGAETEEAMELMETSLQAAADSAAYYDTSLEQAGETLMSFLKGNFANDAALGVSCTEFTRNAKAAELFGKEYNELSEIQKQQTLLKMVTDSQELSGAMGQASREADGFENVMGNLKESWKQFQAAVGMPALKLVVPIIQKATTGISGLGEKVGRFIDDMGDGEKRTSLFQKALDSMFSPEFQNTMQAYTTRFFPNLLGQLKANTVEAFAGQFGKLQNVLTKLKSVIQPIAENYLEFFVDRLYMLVHVAEQLVAPAIGFVSDAFLTVSDVILTAIKPAIDSILEGFRILQAIVYEAVTDYIVPALESFLDMAKTLWAENQDKITKIGELFSTVFTAIAGIVQWFVGIVESYLYPMFIWLVGFVQSNMENIKACFQSAFDIIGGIINFFVALFTGNWQGMWDAVLSILTASVDLVQNWFTLMKDFVAEIMNVIWSKMVEIWENIKISVSTKISAMVSTVQTKFEEIRTNIAEKLNSVKTFVADNLETIRNNFSAKFEEIKSNVTEKMNAIKTFVADNLETIRTNFSTKWNEIKTNLSNTADSILSTVQTKFESVRSSIATKINAAKDTVKSAIDAIKGFFNFEFRWPHIPLPHFSISPSGWKVGDLLDGVIPSLGIDWYAKGGVLEEPTAFGINGNRLMVGGEAGPEAVAPIDTLQRYIAEAVAAQNSGLVDILQKILSAILSGNIEMKDKFIEALEEMRFDINNREFARLVKAVN